MVFEIRVNGDERGVLVDPPRGTAFITVSPTYPEFAGVKQNVDLDGIGFEEGTVADVRYYEVGPSGHRVISLTGVDVNPLHDTVPGMVANMAQGTVESVGARGDRVVVSGPSASFVARGIRIVW